MNDQQQQYSRGPHKSQKKFAIVTTEAAEETDIGQDIKNARTAVVRDPELSDGAVRLFVLLLDLAVSRSTYFYFGSVLISVTKISEHIHRCARAIYGWKKELIGKRYIWLSQQAMPNFWPVDVYHISALEAPPHEGQSSQMPTRDGFWGNGARRTMVEPGPGARAPGQKALGLRGTKCNRTKNGSEHSNPSVLPKNAPESGTNVPPSEANNAAESGKVCGGEQQSMPLAAAKSATGSGMSVPLGAAQNDTGQRHKPADIRRLKSGALSHSESTHTLMPKFEELDYGCFKRLRPAQGDKMIERCKAQIHAIEQSREPIPNAKEIVAAYKARIRDVKNWVAGILPEGQQ